MDVAITGSTGLIGSALARSLTADGHRPIRVVRPGSETPDGPTVQWDLDAGTIDSGALEGIDAVVHLAGEGIASGRWTEEQRRRIHDSRSKGTALLAEALAGLDRRPGILVSGSAVGYYGSRGQTELDETSTPGDDFLAHVCLDWEAATGMASAAGIPVANIRTGIVLSPDGGMLDKVVLPFKLGLGGKAGDGRQWMSWIALTDVVGAIRFVIEKKLDGPVNLTAPEPVTNAQFTKTMGTVLHRPTVIPIPKFVTKLPLGIGPLADSLLFSGAKVHPRALTEAGYSFTYPTLDSALEAMLGSRHEQSG